MRFRRRSQPDEVSDGEAPPEALDDPEGGVAEQTPTAEATGPWDVADRQPEPGDFVVDLGSLVLTGRPDFELQLPVDEATGEVVGAVFAGSESAVELRAFAAPRNGDIWPDVRRALAAEVARSGGTATEVEGPQGTEVRIQLPAAGPDGTVGTQVSRCIGFPGPRWLLRATVLGRAAVEPGADEEVLALCRDVIVVRGSHPAAPGDLLPLRLPENARRVDLPESPGGSDGVD